MRSMVAAAGLVCLMGPAFAAESSDADQAFLKWLQSPANGFGAALNAHDTAKLVSFYTDDAIRVTPFGIVSGRAEIEKGFAAAMKNNPRDFKVTFAQAHVIDGDTAWAAGSWSVTVSVPGNDELHNKGYWSDVYHRDGDVWKLRVDGFSLTPPPPPPTK
ncbi:MAG TPA: nuclear transport factor 2 family protein [Stellaceae bacterium]|nr:nuclear transport factor 2 family protein [Stellaceae bacterium]